MEALVCEALGGGARLWRRRETAAAREVVEAMRRRRSWMEYGGKWACGAVTPSWLPRARGPRWLFPYELSSVE
jgi:hypothetical protein